MTTVDKSSYSAHWSSRPPYSQLQLPELPEENVDDYIADGLKMLCLSIGFFASTDIMATPISDSRTAEILVLRHPIVLNQNQLGPPKLNEILADTSFGIHTERFDVCYQPPKGEGDPIALAAIIRAVVQIIPVAALRSF
ncbi:hypothetical protein GYMLUDRAFT_244061 [Collybiopsis luxurians FD-317 M1]|uniref:Uncharacterized protein n=1 Tax=Collybiopsis luxurians FD-317 M1 TaxID=944289 RepID=A0A0D0CXF6_9AGAR|nr:hypothetical protein GYMLUDRAFT_244061 [Collybiopsis luxurians FD-317 M1]